MKFIYFSLIIGFLFSCKKEGTNSDIVVSFPQTLYGTKITNKTDVRLFTNRKEIFDKAVIGNFIKNSTIFNLQENSPTDSDSIRFITQDTAVFGSSSTKLHVIKTGEQFLFYSPLTPIPVTSDTSESFFKYTAPKITLSNGGLYTNYIYVAYGDYAILDVSLLSYKLKYSGHPYTGTSTPGGETWGTMPNEFNENYVTITDTYNDTLAIQEFKITCKAK